MNAIIRGAMRHTGACLAVLALAGLIPSQAALQAVEWTRFRGPGGGGLGAGQVPNELDQEKNLRWKSECGLGASSPVVAAGRVFVTSHSADERSVECFSEASGERLWVRSVRKARSEHSTAPGGPASPSPAVDASSVYAFFPDVGLLCYGHDGQERWQKPLGPFHSFHGLASSLIVADGRVILQADQLQDSFLAAFAVDTGVEVWRAPRFDGPIGGYSTPSLRTTAGGKVELIASGPTEVIGYDAATGVRNWTVSGATNAPISVPLVHENWVYVCEPSFSQNPFPFEALKRHDKNQDGAITYEEVLADPPLFRIAQRIDKGFGNSDGQITAAEMDQAFASFVGGGGLVAIEIEEQQGAPQAAVKWSYRKTVPQIPSLLVLDNTLFMVADSGILTTLDPRTGSELQRARLGHGAKYYASPVSANGKILFLDTEGKAAVVSATRQWQRLGTSDLGDRCFATPAIVPAGVIVRGQNRLYCFGESG